MSLIMALVSLAGCYYSVNSEVDWKSTNNLVYPIATNFQASIMARIQDNNFERINYRFARKISENIELSKSQYYYIAKISYIGEKEYKEIPTGISMSMDVSNEGVGYITTYRLTKGSDEKFIAALVQSDVPLNSIVSVCGAAE